MIPDFAHVLAVLNSQLEIHALLPQVLDASLSLTGAERAYLLIADQNGKLTIQCARDNRNNNLEVAEFQGSRSIIQNVIDGRTPLLISDLSKEPAFLAAESVRTYGLKAALCMPIWNCRPMNESKTRIIGVLYLDSSSVSSGLREEHLQLMEALVSHISISIENAQLFEEINRQRKEIEHLNAKLEKKVETQERNLIGMKDLLAETQRELGKVYGLGNIIGKSKSMLQVYSLLEKVVKTDATVLILGESGTGKELVARYIHYNGRRTEQPMVSINCSAFNDTLLESELFGYKKGAFTGAVENKIGLFELAHQGTLFLDEVGEMSQDMQRKFLRVLEDKKIRPVGGKEEVQVDVRIIAATNSNLGEDMKQGKFRQDLYYRLNVITIHLPPLRERREDIPLLVDFFTHKISNELNRSVVEIPKTIMQGFLEHDWPGNVRELENELRRAFILEEEYKAAPQQASPQDDLSLDVSEKKAILRALEFSNGNKRKAAEMLGIPRSTFYVKLAKYGIF